MFMEARVATLWTMPTADETPSVVADRRTVLPETFETSDVRLPDMCLTLPSVLFVLLVCWVLAIILVAARLTDAIVLPALVRTARISALTCPAVFEVCLVRCRILLVIIVNL